MLKLLTSLSLSIALTSSCWSSETSDSVDINQHTPGIFQITCRLESGNEPEKKTASGFIFDHNQGIICTTRDIIGMAPVESIEITTHDGTRYENSSIELLGASPANIYGQHSFLRLKELKESKQIPIDPDFIMKKGDPIRFFIKRANDYTVVYGSLQFWILGTFMAILKNGIIIEDNEKREAHGGPVFDQKGNIIGQIDTLTCSKELLVRSIWYASYSYKEYVNLGMFPRAFALTPDYIDMETKQLSLYFDIPLDELNSFLLPENEEPKTLSYVNNSKESSAFKFGDILLTIDDQLVGSSTLRKSKVISAKQSVSVQVYRGTKKMTIQAPVAEIEGVFPPTIDVDGVVVQESSPIDAWKTGFPIGSPFRLMKSPSSIVTVDSTPTPTFVDFLRVLYQIIMVNGDDNFRFYGPMSTKKANSLITNDITQWRGKKMYVYHFDRDKHQWVKTDFVDYAKALIS